MPALKHALRLFALGLALIPLRPRTKLPALDSWKQYQHVRPSETDLREWFGNSPDRNIGVVLGEVSGVAVIESDSQVAEDWCRENLPATPVATRSARGIHRYYTLPEGIADIPAFVADTPKELKIEIKRQGHYVLAPGSIHPTGHVYAEVEPWPSTLASVPLLPTRVLGGGSARSANEKAEPLPPSISSGGRNDTLFREGCRMRRLGLSQEEIEAALTAINRNRCQPALDSVEVAAIAKSCSRYEPTSDLFPTTEQGDAEFFAAAFGEHVRYDHRRRRWLLFDANRWVPQRSGEIYRLALDAIRARQRAAVGNKERLKWALGGEARKRQSNLLALAQNVVPIADAGDNWDPNPFLLGTPNGVVDLQTGRLRPGRPEDRITMAVSVPFNSDARCPTWEQAISQIFEDNASLIAYVQRWVGYSLTADCREEALLIAFGDGANGKGTLFNTVARVFGDYADDLPFSAFEQQARGGIPNDIAKLVGKRFVTSSETSETQRLNEARIKALTGRDPMTVRFLYGEFFTFQPVSKFWLSTNHKPEVHDDSEGFWRRLHLVPFNASFIGREDKTLKDRLLKEAEGILAWSVRGCLAWQREGLNPPAAVREATREYRNDSSPLARFIEQRCVLAESARETVGRLFEEYCRFAPDSRMSMHAFSRAMRQQFRQDEFQTQRVTFVGIGLRALDRGDR